MSTIEQPLNHHQADTTAAGKSKGGRPPKAPELTVEQAQAAYDEACAAVTKAETEEREAAKALATATATYDTKKAAHRAKLDALDALEDAKVSARAALRKAQGRTS